MPTQAWTIFFALILCKLQSVYRSNNLLVLMHRITDTCVLHFSRILPSSTCVKEKANGSDPWTRRTHVVLRPYTVATAGRARAQIRTSKTGASDNETYTKQRYCSSSSSRQRKLDTHTCSDELENALPISGGTTTTMRAVHSDRRGPFAFTIKARRIWFDFQIITS
jgi:hypothetical protein